MNHWFLLLLFSFPGMLPTLAAEGVELSGRFGLRQNFFLPPGATVERMRAYAESVDMEAIAEQCAELGASWYFVTLSRSEYLMTRSEVHDRLTGSEDYTFDDFLDRFHAALSKRGIQLGVYVAANLGCDDHFAPEPNPFAAALGWHTERNRATPEFMDNLLAILTEVRDRHGDEIALWWVDDMTPPGFPDVAEDADWVKRVGAALKAPYNRVAVNCTGGGNGRHSPFDHRFLFPGAMDYSAGHCHGAAESMGDNHLPGDPLPGNMPWHSLIYLGRQWNALDVRFTVPEWREYRQTVKSRGGSLTFALGSTAGLRKRIPEAQMAALREIVGSAE